MRSATLPVAFAALLALVACADGAAPPVDRFPPDAAPDAADLPNAAPDAAPDAAPPPDDPAAPFYDRGRVLEVAITMDPAHWDALRTQRRNLLDVLGPGCLDGPAPAPFTWFPATVTVDGQTLARVGVRKKGFLGSLDETRPSLKLDFDRYVDGQRLAGISRLTLNNGRQDDARVATCLSYDVFADAGVPAPRCSFAHVTVNGVDLGVYVNVEPIKKPFLRRHFGDDAGVLYEGALSDLRPEWRHTFEREQPDAAPQPPPLDALIDAAAAPDDRLLDALSTVLDLDAFLSFWATEVLVGHWDGYAGNTNNFYLYRAPADGRFHFIPWGTDTTFAPRPDGAALPASVLAASVLAHRLYHHPEGRALYLARLRDLLDTVWRPEARRSELERLELQLYPFTPVAHRPAFAAALAQRRAWLAGQADRLRAELDAGGADWPGGLRDPVCLEPRGTVVATFSTRWGTAHVDDLFATGTGTLAVHLFGHDWPMTAVGAKAGEHPDKPGVGLIAVAGLLGGDLGFLVLWVELPLAAIAPGAPIPLDGAASEVLLMHLPPGGAPALLGIVASGTLTLDQADPAPDAPLTGTLDSPVLTF